MNSRAGLDPDGDEVSRAEDNVRVGAPTPRWKFALYIAGDSPKSMTALVNVRRLCEEYLQDNYDIELVDLLVRPELAQQDQIFAVPTLIRRMPLPVKQIIGDLSDYERTLINLNLPFGR